MEPLRFNNFGGTLGGPVYIPKKWNTEKNKLFFFYSQEFKYFHRGATNTGVVPTAAERSGDFRGSSLPAPIDPLNGQPFPDRVVPSSRWSRNGPLMLKLYPLPNFPGPGGNYTNTQISVTDPREELIRADYNLSPKTQITFRWTQDKWDIMDAFGGGALGIGPGQRNRPGYTTVASWNQTFSPTTLNFFSFSMTHNTRLEYRSTRHDTAAMGLTYPEMFPANRSGCAIAARSPDSRDMPHRIAFAGHDHIPLAGRFQQGVGAHTLKFGTYISRNRRTQNTKATDQGNVTFNTSARNTTRNAIADVLLGNFQNYWEDQSDRSYWSRATMLDFYAQDSWKVNRRLGVELGIRYSLMLPFYDALGQSSTFVSSLYSRAKAPW